MSGKLPVFPHGTVIAVGGKGVYVCGGVGNDVAVAYGVAVADGVAVIVAKGVTLGSGVLEAGKLVGLVTALIVRVTGIVDVSVLNGSLETAGSLWSAVVTQPTRKRTNTTSKVILE